MTLPPVGAIVKCTVVDHCYYGMEVQFNAPWEGVRGSIDLPWISEDRTFGPADYPSVDTILEAVVIAHTPSGGIRLSLLQADLDRWRGSQAQLRERSSSQ